MSFLTIALIAVIVLVILGIGLNAQDPVLENYRKNREPDRLDARLDAM
jgi:hypothetical protein